jgi:hypothetical protein
MKIKTNIRTLLILALVLLLSSNQNIAQNVGIGAESFTPDASAGLELQFNNKGLLIPQIALTGENDASTIPSPASSLLVYNTTVGSGLVAGYYYNAGTPAAPSWKRLTTTNDIVVADGSETIVTAGTNVTITGTGTTGNPYVVNASGGGAACNYVVGPSDELGGYIVYVTPDGCHGLVAATQDLPNKSTWFGAQNEISVPANHNTAGKNFTDWRLPTMYELHLLIYPQRASIGGFSPTETYWSSTEVSVDYAAYSNFSNGEPSNHWKAHLRSVRAVRSF